MKQKNYLICLELVLCLNKLEYVCTEYECKYAFCLTKYLRANFSALISMLTASQLQCGNIKIIQIRLNWAKNFEGIVCVKNMACDKSAVLEVYGLSLCIMSDI